MEGEASPALATNQKSASGRSAGAADPDRHAAQSVRPKRMAARRGVAWPMRSRTDLRSAPPASSQEAWAWRRSRTRKSMPSDRVLARDALGHADQQDGGDDGQHEPDDVELEDAAGAEELGDEAADERPDEAETEGGQEPEVLLAGLDEAHEPSDDEACDEESDHGVSLLSWGAVRRGEQVQCWSGGRGVVDLTDEDLDGVFQEQQPPGRACLVHGLCHVRAVLPHPGEGVLEVGGAGDRDEASDALGGSGRAKSSPSSSITSHAVHDGLEVGSSGQ